MRTCFQVEERIPMNRTGLKHLRNSGRLPAVVFGSGTDNQNIHLSTKEFGKWIRRGSGGIIELNLENHDSIPVLLEAIQRDPVTQEYIHVDFLRVKKDELVRTKVNIEFAGTPRGTKLGGIVQTQSTFIEIESFPDKIPGSIVVDISHLEIGDSFHVGDIELPDGLVLISATNELLLSVVTPKVHEDIEETVEA
ncbi:MAG TPA: 50S ribosomal protein L25 [Paenibacillus sp.]